MNSNSTNSNNEENQSAVFQLTNNDTSDYSPQISGNKVVWQGDDGNDSEVYLYNHDSGTVVQLTDNDTSDYSPQISGNKVVWEGYDGKDSEIYLYDGSQTIQLTNNDIYESSPQISGNNVVWSGYDGNDSEIYLYDGTQTIQLTNNDTSDYSPQISGNKVVWEGYDGKDSEIYFYDGTNTNKLTVNGTGDYSPQISGNNVVWSGYDDNDSEIYLYDGNQTIQLTNNNTSDYSPQISGNNVVWSGYDDNDSEIYLYNGSQTIQLTNNNTSDYSPQISGNKVVWEGYDGNDSEIYLYDGSQTIQLTNNDTSDYSPRISGDKVVWQDYNGNDSEIYLNFNPFLVPGEIQGIKWHDLNGNGQQDASEPGLEGLTIYLDQNQNSQLDQGEVSTVTDANGFYSFTNLHFGNYTVAEQLPPRWQQTYPVGVEYEWSDSTQPGGISFNWVDISSVGTKLNLGDDDYAEVALPFNFSFYGEEYNSIKISSNGYLTFGKDATNYYNSWLPSSYDANNLIAPFWDDLNPKVGGSIYYYYNPTEEQFVVQYQDVPRYEVEGSLTFQTILNSDGTIVYQYDNLNATFNSATVGLENADGTKGTQVAYNENYLNNDLAISFSPVINPKNYTAHEVSIGTGEIIKNLNFGNRLTGIRIEAEDYTKYYDTTTGNIGGVYRNDDVDLGVSEDVGGGYTVGWIDSGEWLTYNVNIPETSTYQLFARVASGLDSNHSLSVSIDGQTTTLNFNGTGGWQSWSDVAGANLNLTAGNHELKLDLGTSGFNVNYIDLVPAAGIRIEVEDYTNYYDTTAGNIGGVYRNDDVDLGVSEDVGGGYTVGWIDSGEWLTYNVNIPETGLYQPIVRVASDVDATHSLDISIDGQTTTLNFNGTGGWQSWSDAIAKILNLTAGTHELKINLNSSGFNLNYIDLLPYIDLNLESDVATDTLLGNLAQTSLVGDSNNDLLTAENDSDHLLSGSQEKDVFVLGNVFEPYYAAKGWEDYVLVTDFASGDVLQLHGSADNYYLGASPEGLPKGTAIFWQGSADEAIAVVEDVLDLTIDSNSFVFI
ncbi:Carbohydrate binding family 6 [Stanieria cyanosphaera PCC 7437]|uniref:Carbohydrate binding family 6 n=1 Tax=Stanieria cyanosphaera (strain ATCC 29371 / PCC 7437) TaxID=111780 RepID=K9Y085_STAC7|nr:carbohydrate-binding protein [Stanieria cyanosphaera]AFZ37704.1 Carbohydrate binding family 6 [Stanieria cyanosphaera PCC 7437]